MCNDGIDRQFYFATPTGAVWIGFIFSVLDAVIMVAVAFGAAAYMPHSLPVGIQNEGAGTVENCSGTRTAGDVPTTIQPFFLRARCRRAQGADEHCHCDKFASFHYVDVSCIG